MARHRATAWRAAAWQSWRLRWGATPGEIYVAATTWRLCDSLPTGDGRGSCNVRVMTVLLVLPGLLHIGIPLTCDCTIKTTTSTASRKGALLAAP